jgi:predicted RNase H-like HicB family nuclease
MLVVYERDVDGAWVASVPSLPGCNTQGSKTLSEARQRVREALRRFRDDAATLKLEERFPGSGSEGLADQPRGTRRHQVAAPDAHDPIAQGAACLEESAASDHPGVRHNALAEAGRLFKQAGETTPDESLRAALQALQDVLRAVELLEIDRGRGGQAPELRETALGARARAEACKASWTDPSKGTSGFYITPRVIAAVRTRIDQAAQKAGLS